MAGKDAQTKLVVSVYSHIASPRLQYVLRFLSHYYQHPFGLVTAKEDFLSREGVRINYSKETISNSLQVKPHTILFETSIHEIPVAVFQHQNGYPAFFKSDDDTGFDFFAAVFYLLSRYEEYLPHQKDLYGRYAHENSIAFRNGFLRLPLINIWLEDLRKRISIPNQSGFQFLPTYDIDMAWSYREKGLFRNVGGLLRSIIKSDWNGLSQRLKVQKGKASDPFDCFEQLDELHKRYKLEPLYFFHVGRQRNQYDKSISVANKRFQQLIKDIAAKSAVGVHPSWNSGDQPSELSIEKGLLESVIQKTVVHSRQHYIRFTLPQTFRQLIAAGITDDYSMGYGSINGFRASVASSFYWYDLEGDEETALRLQPFCFMDANAYYEQKQTTQETSVELLRYYEQVKRVNGTLITIWHNNILGKDKEFNGWNEVYQNFLESVTS